MRSLERLARAIAESEISDSELRNACQEVSQYGWRHLVQLVQEYRHLPREARSAERTVTSGVSRTTKRPSAVAMQVDNLLRGEAGLSTAEATALLLDALKHEGHTLGWLQSPARSKIAFVDWVARIADEVPARELLRISTLVRNSVAHRDRSDWPLKR